ncbi:aldo-keto reductase family 1 member C3-like [Oryctolagus cuniculus]|uniref:aldo-keto reductase family 1 member C3-like n=1 Tax=Oryctolagus cuniculus TaxID=9986 RepID=UPI00387A78AE
MDLKHQCVALNDGHFFPVLGFGTYAPPEVPKSKAEEATKIAIDTGYRHIDAAYLYQNEVEVGLAIRSKIADGTVKREDIFYTSKAELQCERETERKVFPPLVHSPNGRHSQRCTDPNPGARCLLLVSHAGTGAPALGPSSTALLGHSRELDWKRTNQDQNLSYVSICVSQVECHPYLNQSKLLEFCKSKDIVLVAYSALGSQRDPKWVDQNSPVLLEDPVVCDLAKKHKRTPAQIVLWYQLQRGVVVLAKSFTEKQIKENMQVFKFQLSSEDMKGLDGLNKNLRYANTELVDQSAPVLLEDQSFVTWQKSTSELQPRLPSATSCSVGLWSWPRVSLRSGSKRTCRFSNFSCLQRT